MNPIEPELLQRVQSGDEQAWVELVRRVQGYLLALASCFLRHHADREDALQNTLLRAWRHRLTWGTPAHAWNWLLRVLRTQCYNHLRRHRRDPLNSANGHLLDGQVEGDPDEQLLATESSERLADALARLSPRDCTVLWHWAHGLSYDEIRQAMPDEGLPSTPGGLGALIFRAKDTLRKAIHEPE
jgi:RNA polymerase sigma-70 factor (ECF subfamily)